MAKKILFLVFIFIIYGELFSQSDDLTRLNSLYEKLISRNNLSIEQRKKDASVTIELARQLKNPFILAKTLIYVGKIANRERNAAKTRQVLSEALSISKNIKDEYLEAETEILLCDYFRITINKPDSALVVAKRAYSISQSLNDSTLIKNSGLSLVLTYTSLHDPINTIRFAKATLAYCENDKSIQSRIYNVLAIVYRDAGDLRESIRYQELSLQIADESISYMQMASLMNSIAGSHAQLMEFNQAIEFHKKALEIYTKVKETFGIAYTHNLMGMTFLSAKRSAEAIKNFKEAIARFTRIDSKQQMAFAQSNLATEYMNVRRVDDAEKYVKSAIKNSEFINDKLSMSDAYSTAGRYYRIKGMIDQSIVFLKKAAQCAKEINNPVMLQSVYEQLSDSYDEKGDSKNALIFLQLKNVITDTIARQNAQRAYIEMMIKYETAKMKEEVSKANGNISRLKVEAERKTIFLIVIIVISISVVSIIMFLYWKKISYFFSRYSYLSRKPFNDARNIKAVFSVMNKEIPEVMHVDKETSAQLVAKLKIMMNEEKLFLRSDLTLTDLAKNLETNTSYLSRVINDEYAMNFSNFMNKYRIEEAQRLIDNHKQDVLTFEGIAKSCGFLSRSSFNQAFKKFTGMTPTEYSQKI